jgi:hypothetical protein
MTHAAAELAGTVVNATISSDANPLSRVRHPCQGWRQRQHRAIAGCIVFLEMLSGHVLTELTTNDLQNVHSLAMSQHSMSTHVRVTKR